MMSEQDQKLWRSAAWCYLYLVRTICKVVDIYTSLPLRKYNRIMYLFKMSINNHTIIRQEEEVHHYMHTIVLNDGCASIMIIQNTEYRRGRRQDTHNA